MDIGNGAPRVNTRSAGMTLRLGALLLCGAIAACAGASGGSPSSLGKIDFEFTGTVYDAVTKQPIEGVYVFASYREPVGVNSRCYKTRGMYTGKDGKYRFPIEKLDGYSPWFTSAIKPGYFFGSFDTPKRDVWNRQDASSYADRNLYLIPQDPAKPSPPVFFVSASSRQLRNGATRVRGGILLRGTHARGRRRRSRISEDRNRRKAEVRRHARGNCSHAGHD